MKVIIASVLVSCFMLCFTNSVFASDMFWKVRSIDTMKYSRDRARDINTTDNIPLYVKNIANLGANYISLGTPYDDEFIPVLNDWVQESRKNHLKIWFRGNFSSWEGWFGYPNFTSINEYYNNLDRFIVNNPGLFENGDIFSPISEPENGIIGDPRKNDVKATEYNSFLVNTYSVCKQAFMSIGKNVTCGYISVNGDIAKHVITKDSLENIGNVLVIDHYVKSPEILAHDIKMLHEKFNSKIVLGEFGAPIPDINGSMDSGQQAHFIENNLVQFVKLRNIIEGINYWTAYDSSTSLFTENNNLKPAASVIKNYYSPIIISGKVTGEAGETLKNIEIKTSNDIILGVSDYNGNYSVVVPRNLKQLIFYNNSYMENMVHLTSDSHQYVHVTMEPKQKDLLYQIKIFIHEILSQP